MKSKPGKLCSKYLLGFLAVFAMVVGLLIPTQIKAADSYAKDKKGSINVTLNDIGTDVSGESVRIYQVGVLGNDEQHVTFDLVKDLESANIDLNEVTTSEANLTAAKTLADTIGKMDKTAAASLFSVTAKTDEKGKVSFADLEQGMYMVMQPVTSAYGVFSPFLVAVPYMEDGENWIYDVDVSPKAQQTDKNGSIEVTKYLAYTDPDTLKQYQLVAPDATYYVGLFCDEDGMIPYQKDYIKTLSFKGSSSTTVKYDNLPDGTYYIFETDQNGTPYKMNKAHTDSSNKTYRCVVGDGTNISTDNKVQIQSHSQEKMAITNIYATIPDEYLVEGQLSIKKNVIEDGQQVTTDDTFYATVYKKSDSGQNELVQTVQLKQNDTVSITVPIDTDDNNTAKKTTFIVEETDANGNAIDTSNFDYKISGEGNVELSMDNSAGSITLTNTVKKGNSSTTEKKDKETTSTKKDTTKQSKKSKSGKTGDNNPIMMWIVIGAVAVLMIIFLLVRRKKSE